MIRGIGVLLFALLLACRGAQESAPPFFHGLQGGQSPEEVQALLALAPDQWQPVEEHNFPRARSLGIRLERVELRRFAHLGCEGRLVMYFFDSRLLKVRFHPEDFPRFRKLMAEREGLDLAPGRTQEPGPGTRIRVLRDPAGGSYVLWEDQDLAARWESLTRRR